MQKCAIFNEKDIFLKGRGKWCVIALKETDLLILLQCVTSQ